MREHALDRGRRIGIGGCGIVTAERFHLRADDALRGGDIIGSPRGQNQAKPQCREQSEDAHDDAPRRDCNERVLVFLDRPGIAHEGEGGFDFLLAEWLSSEKVKIDGNAVAKMKRYRGSAVQNERQSRSGRKQRPDLLLSLGQDFRPGLKTDRHRTFSGEAHPESPGRLRASGVRARTPTTVR